MERINLDKTTENTLGYIVEADNLLKVSRNKLANNLKTGWKLQRVQAQVNFL